MDFTGSYVRRPGPMKRHTSKGSVNSLVTSREQIARLALFHMNKIDMIVSVTVHPKTSFEIVLRGELMDQKLKSNLSLVQAD